MGVLFFFVLVLLLLLGDIGMVDRFICLFMLVVIFEGYLEWKKEGEVKGLFECWEWFGCLVVGCGDEVVGIEENEGWIDKK